MRDLKNLTKELNKVVEGITLNANDLKSVVLPSNITAQMIKQKYPEIVILDTEFRSKEDIEDWIVFNGEVGQLYAAKFGYNDKWFVGGLILSETINEQIDMGNKLEQLTKLLPNLAADFNISINQFNYGNMIEFRLYTPNIIVSLEVLFSGQAFVKLRNDGDFFDAFSLESFIKAFEDLTKILNILKEVAKIIK